jgi:4-amino-4-deoxy-L-arabinose transferase-like glycosyltransferase
MFWLESLDLTLFQWLNQSLANGIFDWFMPLLGNKGILFPAAPILVILLWWRGNRRLRICLVFLVLAVLLGDILVCGPLKHAIARPRPHLTIPEARLLTGRGRAASMPSSHAANWFAAMAVLFCFYPRSIRVVLPLATMVGFSRVYTGSHYPSDVLAGAFLGTLYGVGIVRGADFSWQQLGRRWFPHWHDRLPSLRNPDIPAVPGPRPEPEALDQHWLRFGYFLIGILLLARLLYIGGGRIELSEDEAYQWLWSKQLALSYYSKPPLIAYTQFLGTTLWGDNEFGVRFFSPVIAATISLLLLRFFSQLGHPRVGFQLILITSATPLLAVGATLMTIDPLSVLFWTAAMLTGWRAIEQNSTRLWMWTGIWMGLGFLSKYVALLQWFSWALFFLLWKPARSQLRRPGPYLALAIQALATLPVVWWNVQNDWVGLRHVGERGGLDTAWQFTSRFFVDFSVAQVVLLNPVFFVAMIGAFFALRHRQHRSPLQLFFVSMGLPLFLGCLLYALRSRVHPNWIAPAVIPLLCFAVVYWNQRRVEGVPFVKPWLHFGIALGLVAVILLHETRWVGTLIGRPVPVHLDPLRRVRGWEECADHVRALREELLAEGRPVFIVGDHYGIAGLLSFYLPEARAAIGGEPLVFCVNADRPRNQLHLWGNYSDRRGHTAIYVRESRRRRPIPARLEQEFASVTDLGVYEIRHRGRPLHTLHLAICRDLQ